MKLGLVKKKKKFRLIFMKDLLGFISVTSKEEFYFFFFTGGVSMVYLSFKLTILFSLMELRNI